MGRTGWILLMEPMARMVAELERNGYVEHLMVSRRQRCSWRHDVHLPGAGQEQRPSVDAADSSRDNDDGNPSGDIGMDRVSILRENANYPQSRKARNAAQCSLHWKYDLCR